MLTIFRVFVMMDLTTVEDMQSELKRKNEMINMLIGQNFQELQTLQKKHQEIIEGVTETYQNSFNQLKASFQQAIDDTVNQEYQMTTRTITTLRSDNKFMATLIRKLSAKLNSTIRENQQTRIYQDESQALTLENKALRERLIALETAQADLITSRTQHITSENKVKELEHMINSLIIERDLAREESARRAADYQKACQSLTESESSMITKLSQLQTESSEQISRYEKSHREEIERLTIQHETHIQSVKKELGVTILERGRQIDGLTSCLKAFTDSQYVALNELEKYKNENEKLRQTHEQYEQQINSILQKCHGETDDERRRDKRDREILMESYKENIRKAQELNSNLQEKLEKAFDTISKSKAIIHNLRESNERLKKLTINSETKSNTESEIRIQQLQAEIDNLQAKLDASIELNRRLRKH
jgi:hypothetical protein